MLRGASELFLLEVVIGVLGEQKQDCKEAKEKTEKEPQPGAPTGVLSPKRAERAEQEKNEARVACVLNVVIELGNFRLKLSDSLGLLLLGECGSQKANAEKCGENKDADE